MERTRKEMMEYTRGLRTMMDVVISAQQKAYFFEEVCHKLAIWNDEVLIPWRDAIDDDGDELAISAFEIPLPRF